MNTLEDTLRAALHETGAEITPQSVPPLRLHDGWRRPGRPGIGSRRRWPAWLAPLAAAAAVAVVIAASLAISATFHDRARQPFGGGVMTFNPGNTLMTPDGTKIVTGTTIVPRGQSRPEQLAITTFSTRTGKVVASEDRFEMMSGWQEVLWTSPSGSTLIVTDPRGKQGASVTGVLTGGRFTPLPRAPQTNQIAW
jgi:hypothetical protein